MKLKPILIKTDKSNYSIIEDLSNRLETKGILFLPAPHGDKVEYYHIYLTDPNAEIKGWYYDSFLNGIRHTGGSDYTQNTITDLIIASTDKALELPQLSEQSIKLLINYYNENSKMPDEVEVESKNNWTTEIDGDLIDSTFIPEIKLNPQGTVDITIPEDRLFTKEEMELSFQAGNEFGLYMDEQDNFEVNHNPFRIWIKNL
jgi:hypothetical protein